MTKILLCHNYYQQPGGEDLSYEAEVDLLRSRGHDVVTYTAHNDSIDRMSRITAARKTIWNTQTYRELTELIIRERPEIMHCTNTFPLLSPAAYYAASRSGVVTVQSLRNYRLLCLNTYFLRNGSICEDCVGKTLPLRAVARKCYRDSYGASAVAAAMLGVHNILNTWNNAIDLFFCPSEFTRQKFVEAGFPPAKLAVKPNFVDPDPGPGTGRGDYAVYVGRLSPEKDVQTLLDAWSKLSDPISLKIIGDGPLAKLVETAASDGRIEWLGHRPLNDVLSIVGEAKFLIMPSIWYETFGRTIVEAFAKGTPVIVSSLGAMAELVDDGLTGRRFEAGNPDNLLMVLHEVLADPENLSKMRSAARAKYEQFFTADRNYEALMRIYDQARLLRDNRKRVA